MKFTCIAFLFLSLLYKVSANDFSGVRQQIENSFQNREYEDVIEKCQEQLNKKHPDFLRKISSGNVQSILDEIKSHPIDDINERLFYLKYILDGKSKLSEIEDFYVKLREGLIAIAEITSNPLYLSYGYNRLGKDLFREKQFEESAKWFINALEVANDHRAAIQNLSKKDLYDLLDNFHTANYRLGRIFSKLHNFQESIKYYRKAVAFADQTGDLSKKGLTSYQLGNTWIRVKSYDSAIFYYKNARSIFLKIEDFNKLAAVYSNIGNVYNFQNNLNKALDYYDSATIVMGQIDDKVGQAYLLNNIANLQFKTNNLNEAIDKFKSSLKIANEIKDKNLMKANVEAIADIFHLKKSYDSAFHYYYQTQALNTEIYNSKLSESIHELGVTHKTKEKEWEISRQQEVIEAKSIQQTYLILIIILLVLITLFGWFSYRSKKKANRLLSLQKEVAEQHSLEKSTLMQELHHRVKNNMELISSVLNLQSHMLTDESAKSAISESKGRVDAMSLIHQKLYFSNNITHVRIREYIEQLINSIAFTFGYINNDGLKIQTDVANIELKVDLAIPLCIIINELITNAFKYAFTNKEEAILIVSLKKRGHKLELLISDNGKGINEVLNSEPGKSFGLQLVNTMIEQLNATMEVDNSDGTSYIIHVENMSNVENHQTESI